MAREQVVRPITPAEVAGHKIDQIPELALEAFNELIVQHSEDGHATFKQSDVVALMVEKGLDHDEIFEKGWLNVEDLYREVGWKVTYDKPGYNETYPATFTFSPSRIRN